MKKHLLGWVAMAGMLFVTSCAKDVDVVSADSSEATVTFNVGLESALSTRAIGDGLTAKSLYYAAIDESGVVCDETVTMEELSTTVTISLEKGKKYQVAFWAQSEAAAANKDNYYDLSEFPKVKIFYDGAKNNDEGRDAFYGSTEVDLTQTIATNPTVTLKRPFAQINFATEGNSTTYISSSMKVKNGLATSFDVLTGTASGSTEATFADADLLKEKLSAKGKEYTWLSMSYVLFENEAATLELEFSFTDDTQTTTTVSKEYVPVEDNKRTNLLGSTNLTDVEIEVDKQPGFGDEEEADAVTVSEILIEAENGTVTFMATLVIPEGQSVSEAYFVCTPEATVKTRAEEDGVVRIKAEVDDDMLTAVVSDPQAAGLKPGVKYAVTVEIDGETIAAGSGVETGNDDIFTIPDEQDGETEYEGDGSKENPYTIADVLKLYDENNASEKVWVTGTITGYYKSNAFVAGAESAEASNIAIGNGDTNLPVQLGSNSKARTALNLQDNPTNVGKTVKVYGTIEKYFSVAGVKNVTTDYELEGAEEGGDDQETPTEVKAVSVSDFLAAEVSTTQVYELTGTVSNIANTQYGNFDLTDDSGKVYVYGLTKEYVASNDQSFASLGIAAGDKITIRGYRAEYNGTAQVGSAWLVRIEEKAPEVEDKPTTGNYVKVNAGENITAGKYLIVFGENAHATVSGKDFIATEAVSIEDTKIAASTKIDAAAVEIGADGSIKLPDGTYLKEAEKSCATSDTPVAMTITATDNGVSISGGSYILYKNGTSYYRFYTDKSSTSGYTLPDLYQYVAE